MKTFLGILTVLCGVWCGSALGQGEGIESCTECRCVADNTCTTEPGGCGTDTGCSTLPFTAECGGDYTVKVVLTCSSSSACGDCYGCAWISYEGEVIWSSIAQNICVPDSCQRFSTVTLTSGKEYKLHACLRACSGESCNSCASCTVRGYVYQKPSDCTPIACNP